MSANNWRECPSCRKERMSELQKLIAEAEKGYGKISADKYGKLKSKIEEMRKEILEGPEEETLREDYEIGINQQGTFYVGYSASCGHCDYSFKFKREEPTGL